MPPKAAVSRWEVFQATLKKSGVVALYVLLMALMLFLMIKDRAVLRQSC